MIRDGGGRAVEESDGLLDPMSPLRARRRAYEAAQAVLSDDHHCERGVEGAWAVAAAVLAESGAAGLAATMVELSLHLAAAFERIAAEQEMAAVDLAAVVRGLTLPADPEGLRRARVSRGLRWSWAWPRGVAEHVERRHPKVRVLDQGRNPLPSLSRCLCK